MKSVASMAVSLPSRRGAATSHDLDH